MFSDESSITIANHPEHFNIKLVFYMVRGQKSTLYCTFLLLFMFLSLATYENVLITSTIKKKICENEIQYKDHMDNKMLFQTMVQKLNSLYTIKKFSKLYSGINPSPLPHTSNCSHLYSLRSCPAHKMAPQHEQHPPLRHIYHSNDKESTSRTPWPGQAVGKSPSLEHH